MLIEQHTELLTGDKVGAAQLRRVLDIIFPADYLRRYHRPPQSICSLLQIKCWPRCQMLATDKQNIYYSANIHATNHDDPTTSPTTSPSQIQHQHQHQCQVSSEPSSRYAIRCLRQQLQSSLEQHGAKAVGLCHIRRTIYDQCLGGLLVQVVGVI